MGAQVINLWRRDVDQSGTTSTIIMVNQGVTGPRGADGAGVSVATKESGTEKVAVTTVLDFLAGFDVAGAAGVASVSVDLTEYSGGALPVAGGGTGATDASGARTNLGLGTAATTAASSYATAAQGATADAALPRAAGGASVENIGAVESNVNTVATSGGTETLDTSLYGVHDVTMDQACTFTFSNPAPSGKATIFTLILRGAFTPTWPASVDWPDATPPTHTTPAVYVFTTVDAGTTWFGNQAGKAYA